MRFFSEKAKLISPYVAGEQPKDKRYVKLNTNENPYPPSPKAAEALRLYEADNLRLYPRPNADGLRAAIAEAEGVSEECIFCGNGSDEVLALCFPAFFDAGGKPACFAQFTYSFYEVYAQLFSVPFVKIPLKEEFYLDLEGMKACDCKGYFIANPNAPTSVGIPREKMREFCLSVPDKLVIADEAYMDFYGQSCVPLIGELENLLVVKTFSKSYSLAGLRCGYAVGNPSLIDALFRMKDCFNSYPVDAVCQAVATAAIGDREYHDQTVALVVSERERVRNELLSLGFTVPESGANFLFAGRTKKNAGEIYRELKEAGVLVRYWDKPFLSDFVRITIGTPKDNDVLLENLKRILSKE